ncbi:aldo/keto reductase [bacterium]|nr:aldo/keto reductase [bacterium]
MLREARLGLGTWQLGGASEFGGRTNGWGALDEARALAILDTALAQGIRVFDTADAYGKGLSETRIGKVVGNRDDCYVITKVGQREQAQQALCDFSPSWIQYAVSQSLKRLQRDRIELLLLHSPPLNFDYLSQASDVFTQLKVEGKIGGIGVSVRTSACAKRAIAASWIDAVEVIFNAVDRRAAAVFAESTLPNPPSTRTSAVQWIARSVLASGWLARSAGQQLSQDDLRAHVPGDLAAWFAAQDRGLDWLNDLPGGKTVSLLRFAISYAAVDCALLGVRRPEQIAAIVQAKQLGALPTDVIQQIQRSSELYPGWV